MKFAPRMYAHGKISCDCLRDEGITVVERTDEALYLKFDGDDHPWPLGWAAYFSGRFVSFDEADTEPAPWLG